MVFKKGQTPWNKGKTNIFSEESRRKMRLAKLGKHHTEEHKRKIKENAKTNYNYGMKNKHHLEKAKEKIRQARYKQILPVKDTSIEVKLQEFLKQLGYDFMCHKYIELLSHGYQCDIFIPDLHLVIEADGDYWHGNPLNYPNPTHWQKEQINRDNIRTKELIRKGYKVLRIWETEIKEMTLNDFKEKMGLI